FARALLAMAAADRWGVAWEECEAEGGFITHGRRRLRFGELAEEASQGTPPTYPPLRPGRTGALYGQSMPRLDLPGKIDGSTNFAADIRLPDMVYAAIRQGPHGDTRLLRYDRAAGESVAGFLGAVRHERWLASVATNSWAAARALDAMVPRFETRGSLAQTSGTEQRLKSAAEAGEGTRIVTRGDVVDAMAGRPVVGADYMVAPMLHAQPEPPAATAEPTDDGVRVWFGTQSPGAARAAVAEALGLDVARVTLFPMPVGGNTGAAMHFDVAVQAALVARAMARPVQLSWTRTEDILRDCPRPAARIALRASLSTGATIDAWHASIATQPARHEWRARLGGASADAARRGAAGTSDAAMVSGATPPYLIPNLAVDFVPVDTGLPAGYHRGGADMLTVFAREAFIDELANAAGIDPLSFRISMIGATPELGICLQSVTAMGEWSGGVAGAGQGIACHAMQGSFMAMMAVARQGQNGIIVERLHVSADVGTVLNPTIARQHVENAVAHGLAQAVGLTSKYRRGLAQARRLRDLGLPTLAQMPTIDIQILPSDRTAGSIGDCAATLVAPAIANALFSVTGQRLRRLPLNPRPVD
ncbi:MAG: molybdopterin-dependent oxidoreductase, partial [Sphingopyxis sp.]|nr:molybdopterin-dependent oxidoreductase [Sphingopyxis sp.]